MRIAVVGASLAGLAAGALLARRGCQVTVLEQSARPGGVPREASLRGMCRTPGDQLVWGWSSSRALVRLFGSLRDRPGATARQLFQPVPVGLQVLGHPHRLDWGGRIAAEIAREFPGAAEAWRGATEAWSREAETLKRAGVGLPFLDPHSPGPHQGPGALEAEPDYNLPESPKGRQELRQALAGRSFLEGIREELPAELIGCLDKMALAACWRPLSGVTLPAGLWALHLLAQDVAVLKDGLDGLVGWLAGRLKAAGGELKLEARVKGVKLRGRRVRGVAFSEGRRGEFLEADGVVVAGGQVSRLLPLGWLRARWQPSAGTLMTCLLAVEEDALPEPLAPLAAYRPEASRPGLVLSHNPTRRYALGGRTRRLLNVAWRADDPGAQELELPSELPKRLARLMPFLPGRWELVPQDEATGSPFKRHLIPAVDPRDLDPTTKVKGLVNAGRDLLPGLSTTASLTLGVAAAEAILQKR